ncbi:G-type lectin S-receptor-like serine/threonine-protein kinase LECRK3 [Linum grandiflorum]
MAFSSIFPFSFSLLLLLPISVNSQPRRNVSLGSSITADSNDYWISPSGDFAFGFERVDNSTANGFLVAIVFDKMSERTIVWSANRNNLVPSGSTVQLTSDGGLVLADPSGREIWSPIETAAASYAAMLDTGNFVLAGRDSSTLWESFDQPTDTLLPTQILGRGSQLIAKYSRTNHSMGRFKFLLRKDGYLGQFTTAYPQMGSNFGYWNFPDPAPLGHRLVFNLSGFMYLASNNGSILSYVFQNGESNQQFYQRVSLDFDGVLRYYVYPKGNVNTGTDSERWSNGWTVSYFQPLNLCIQVMGKTGSGACGYNSYCQLGNDQNPICRCPQGYVFLDPSDENKGCIQDFAPQDCRLDESDAFDIAVMPNADWVDGEYTNLESYSEDMCRQACLSDCHCDAAIYGRGICWKKRMPMSNGRVDALVGVKALIKVRKSNTSTSSPLFPAPKKKDPRSGLIIVGSVLLSFSGLINLLAAFLYISKLGRRRRSSSSIVATDQEKDSFLSTTNLRRFSFGELELATGMFKEVLGSGASGTVYKGILADSKELVAVKRLDKMTNKLQENHEFATEVKVIGGTNHRNLVKLVGFCNKGQHRILVYEFMSNGSLADFLFRDNRPSWSTRIEIAYAVARGLVYLHDECSTQIIHCDIKPQNVLLDEFLTAKISDFGLAKLLKVDQTRTMTLIRGTRGYVAPEWFKNTPVTAKVDVHSFGILLLELVCCRKNLKMDVAEEDEIILSDWAADCYVERKLRKVVEDDEEAVADLGRVERFVKVAMWCLQDDPNLRPGMKKVVQMLEGSLQVSDPPDSATFLSNV